MTPSRRPPLPIWSGWPSSSESFSSNSTPVGRMRTRRESSSKRFELDSRRVRILPTGVLLLEKLSELLGQPLQIGKGGLREGVILDLLNGAANGAPHALAA